MNRYALGRTLQFLALVVLPFAIASELMGAVRLGISLAISLLGVALFYGGYVLQGRGGV